MGMVGNARFARLVRSGAELTRTTNSRVETDEGKSLRKGMCQSNGCRTDGLARARYHDARQDRCRRLGTVRAV
eukprot:9486978-Pyramimonas_sp.AAC.1